MDQNFEMVNIEYRKRVNLIVDSKEFALTKLIIICLMLFGHCANAAGYLTDLNMPEVTITKVFSHQNGAVTLFVSGIPANPDSCNDITHVHIKADNLGLKNIAASALTAFAAGKKVGLYTSGCEIIPFWGGTNTRPIITDLWISD